MGGVIREDVKAMGSCVRFGSDRFTLKAAVERACQTTNPKKARLHVVEARQT